MLNKRAPSTRAVRARLGLVAAASVATGLLVPAGASAASTPRWASLKTSGQLDISDLAATARTPDGALHVAWFTLRPNDTYDLLQTPVTAAGAVGTPVPIVTGWASLQGPQLLSSGNSLLAFWSGVQTTVTGDPTDGLDSGVSADGGDSWTVAPSAIANGDFVYGRNTSVTLGPAGALESWYSIADTVVHLGTDPTVPDQTGFGGGTSQTIAVSGSSALAAWCTDVQGPNGVYVQPVNPTDGAPAGPPQLMPGSTSQISGKATAFCPSTGHVQLVARQNKGFFVASVNGARHVVEGWIPGAQHPVTIGTTSGTAEEVASAASPGAKASVWVGWQDGDVIKLRRSNASASTFGATVTLPSPSGELYGLNLDAQADRVDLVARVAQTNGTVTLEHAQAFPGLTLTSHNGKTPTFKVTDAGDPVADVTIAVGSKTATTDRFGTASVPGLAPGRYTARATRTKYVGARATVSVPKPAVTRHKAR